jgi:hypothetical protein
LLRQQLPCTRELIWLLSDIVVQRDVGGSTERDGIVGVILLASLPKLLPHEPGRTGRARRTGQADQALRTSRARSTGQTDRALRSSWT